MKVKNPFFLQMVMNEYLCVCVNPYMSTKVKTVKKTTFNSCILYLIFGGKKLHNCSDSPIPTENQITEVKNSNRSQTVVSHDLSDLWTIVTK